MGELIKNNLEHQRHLRIGMDEDFDAVLDDLKDESAVDLPPHACRSAETFLPHSSHRIHLNRAAIAEFIHQHQS
jgi:hypothetical protein